eukprot:gene10606-2728_t
MTALPLLSGFSGQHRNLSSLTASVRVPAGGRVWSGLVWSGLVVWLGRRCLCSS